MSEKSGVIPLRRRGGAGGGTPSLVGPENPEAVMTITGRAGAAQPATTPGQRALDAALAEVRDTALEVCLVIGSQERRGGRTVPVVTPHAHGVTLGRVHHACAGDVSRSS
jgi:hypothetical protein